MDALRFTRRILALLGGIVWLFIGVAGAVRTTGIVRWSEDSAVGRLSAIVLGLAGLLMILDLVALRRPSTRFATAGRRPNASRDPIRDTVNPQSSRPDPEQSGSAFVDQSK